VTPLTGSTRRERRTVTDGWYIDLDTGVSCEPWCSDSAHAFVALHKQGDPPERPTFKEIGEPERGFPILRRTTERASVVELEVTELSTAPLDAALFVVPADFSCVEQVRQEPVPPFVIRLAQTYERLKRRARIGR
jgi:hypothetical protein